MLFNSCSRRTPFTRRGLSQISFTTTTLTSRNPDSYDAYAINDTIPT